MTRPDVAKAFETYGRLMAKIGGVEQFMRIALGEHLTRPMKASGQTKDLERHTLKIMRMDFGQLLQQVCDKFKLGPAIRGMMKEAKGFRDHLAHNFWVCNLGNLRSERGTAIITGHCELLERHIDKLADILIEATGLDAVAYVNFVASNANDDDAFKGWEERLDAAREAEALAATGGAATPNTEEPSSVQREGPNAPSG